VKAEVGLTFFNPTFGFVHILPKFGLKQPSIFLECRIVWSEKHTLTPANSSKRLDKPKKWLRVQTKEMVYLLEGK